MNITGFLQFMAGIGIGYIFGAASARIGDILAGD